MEKYGRLLMLSDWLHHQKTVKLPIIFMRLEAWGRETLRFTEGWDPVRDVYTYRFAIGPVDVIYRSLSYDPVKVKERQRTKLRRLERMLLRQEAKEREARRVANLPFARRQKLLAAGYSAYLKPRPKKDELYELWTPEKGSQRFSSLKDLARELSASRSSLAAWAESEYQKAKAAAEGTNGSGISRSNFVPLDAVVTNLRSGKTITRRPMGVDIDGTWSN